MLKDWCITFVRPASVSSDIKLKDTHCFFYLLLWILYLHGVSLPGGGLSICEDSAIVSAQNIYGKKQNDKWDQSTSISNIWHILTWLILRTFHNLLGTGVVHLLLGGVGRKHSIKRIGLPLWRAQTTVCIRKRAISSQTGHAGVLKMLQCLWFWTMLFITKEDDISRVRKLCGAAFSQLVRDTFCSGPSNFR